jgi:hypothetical protein
MRRFSSLIGSAAVLALAVVAGPHPTDAQTHWQVAAGAVCESKHSYRFYQRFSSTFELDVAGPNDAIEENEAAFHPKTGKAESRSIWKSAIGADAQPWQELRMVATCAADPWLFPKSVAKCENFQTKATCAKPNCTPPSAAPPFRVPAGVIKDKPLQAGTIPKPKFVVPTPDQSYMVLEAPFQLETEVPHAPFCAFVNLAAKGPGGASHAGRLPVTAEGAKGTVAFVGKPLGKWTMIASISQYTGKPGSAAWVSGPEESRGFYLGPAWPGSKDKPVSVTMLKIVLPAKGATLPANGGAARISIHRDLWAAVNPKQATLTWQYLESPLPGTPWPGQSKLPDVVALAPQLKSPSAPDKDWLNYQRPLDFSGQTAHKSWRVRACVRAYNSDLCQETAFALKP